MRRRFQNGQALVEFALLFPVLATLLFGAGQFGYAFYTYNNLEKAVRDGARYASMRAYGSATFSPVDTTYSTAVKNVVLYGTPTPDPGAALIVHNLSAANVVVSMTTESGHPGRVTVRISGYTMSLPLNTITLNKPSSTFLYVGRFAPPDV